MVPTTLFNTDEVSVWVSMEQFRYEVRTGDELMADPPRISARAERYVRRLVHCNPEVSPSFEVVSGAYAGLLVYAMDHYGFDYLFIARLTNKSVADILAMISGDCRIDLGPRRQGMQSRIVTATPIAQAVRLAEIIATASRVQQLATPVWLRQPTKWGNHNHYEVAAWTDHAAAMLAGMERGLFSGGRFAKAKARAEELIADLHARTRSRKLAKDRQMMREHKLETEGTHGFSGLLSASLFGKPDRGRCCAERGDALRGLHQG